MTHMLALPIVIKNLSPSFNCQKNETQNLLPSLVLVHKLIGYNVLDTIPRKNRAIKQSILTLNWREKP